MTCSDQIGSVLLIITYMSGCGHLALRTLRVQVCQSAVSFTVLICTCGFRLPCMNKHSQAVELEKIIREILYPGNSPFFELNPDGECKSKCVYMCVRLHVSPLQPYVNVCVCAPAAGESFSQSRLAVLVFSMPLQLQRPFNLKPSQFEFPLNIWPIFLL